jgi:hypothetical protein
MKENANREPAPSVGLALFPGRFLSPLVWVGVILAGAVAATAEPVHNSRLPGDDVELSYWLENMLVFHRFTVEEVTAATGLSAEEVNAATKRLNLDKIHPLARKASDPLLVLPYPGGRHPRIGFLDGAIDPQRETKISVFTPWNPNSYVVVDVPEAIWSNLGLTYLAHTHVETIWDLQRVKLPPLEWQRKPNGVLIMERTLPNQIAFGTRVTPRADGVMFDLWLKNGTAEPLSNLRVQNCVMLKMAAGFNAQTNQHTVFAPPYAAIKSEAKDLWIITAFDPCQHPWANPPVPCVHADPQFPDCPPGETVRIHGWLSFYEGQDIATEFKRLDGLGWRNGSPADVSTAKKQKIANN